MTIEENTSKRDIDFEKESPSAIMLTLNSKLNFEQAKLINVYNSWKKL